MSAQALSNTARDPQIAIQEEYDLAVKRGTVEAIDLFIARHPDNPLTGLAQKRRLELIAKDPKQRQ